MPPLLQQCPFLPGVRGEGEHYLRGQRNAVPCSRYLVFGLPELGSKATTASPANAAIAADYRAYFGPDRLRFWSNLLL